MSGDLTADHSASGGSSLSPSGSASAAVGGTLQIDLFGGFKRERRSAAAAALDFAKAEALQARLDWLSALVDA